MAFRKIIVVGVSLAFITYASALPKNVDTTGQQREPRQDEDDGATPASANFGAHVAQIIAGAFTGNIDSIIKGSFGFIENPMVNKLSHNTWETLKGNPTKSPAWEVDTTAGDTEPVSQPETARPAPPQQPQNPSPPTPAAVIPASAPEQARPAQQSQPASAPSGVYAPDVYYPGSPYYPTRRSQVRTTQPTYATLAPLHVIERTPETEVEPEETSTPPTTTEDDDEGEEGVSREIGEGISTSAPSSGTGNRVSQSVTTAAAITTGNVETTTEDDDDQDQIDYLQYGR